MSEFAVAAREIAVEMSGDLAEQVVAFEYVEVLGGNSHSYRGIASDVKQYETDGQSVTMTSSKWWCLQHELSVKPQIDDYLLINGEKHHIARVTPSDQVIGWYIYTNAS